MTTIKAPEETRNRILESAFDEFYHHGFQGGSLNRIIEKARTTKGALFHHFKGKNDLGYAVVDQLMVKQLQERWIEPLNASTNPIESIKVILRKSMADCASNNGEIICNGCPMNNLAQEMSPLDEGFRVRLENAYARWREAIHNAICRGIENGFVNKNVAPDAVAAFFVASITGTIGTVKNAQSHELLHLIVEETFRYLDALKP